MSLRETRVLFVTYRAKCIDHFLKVATALKEKEIESVFILPNFKDKNEAGQFIGFLGINYMYIDIPQAFREPFTFWLRQARIYERISEQILNKYNPKLIIFVDTCLGFRAFFQKVAAERKIKTAVLQWYIPASNQAYKNLEKKKWMDRYTNGDIGIFNKVLHFLSFSSEGAWRFSQVKNYYDKFILNLMGYEFSDNTYYPGSGSDFFITMNEDSKKHFLSQGINEEKIVVLGSPSFDEYWEIMHSDLSILDREIRASLNINNEKPIITFGTQPLEKKGFLSQDEYMESVREIIKLLLNYKEKFNIIIKLHPADLIDEYNVKLSSFTNFIKIVKDVDLKKLIYISKIYISSFSASSMDAIIFGIPVITYNFWRKDDILMDYFKSFGGTLHAQSLDELQAFIQKLVKNDQALYLQLKKEQENIRHSRFILDGGCTSRIVDFCHSIINNALS